MKRSKNTCLRPEYDFATMQSGMRGKYAKRYREGTNIVLPEPNVAEAFPNDASVNQALRGVLNTYSRRPRNGRTRREEPANPGATPSSPLQAHLDQFSYAAPPAASSCAAYGRNTVNTAAPSKKYRSAMLARLEGLGIHMRIWLLPKGNSKP